MASISGINTRFFKDLFDWKRGRMNRTDYIFLLVIPIGMTELLLDWLFPLSTFSVSSMVIGIFLEFWVICFAIKRLHDCGLSGWWVVLYRGSYVGAIIAVFIHATSVGGIFAAFYLIMGLLLFFWPGQKCENKYGKPYKDSAMFTYPALNNLTIQE